MTLFDSGGNICVLTDTMPPSMKLNKFQGQAEDREKSRQRFQARCFRDILTSAPPSSSEKMTTTPSLECLKIS